jgi:hypothetical protein
MSYINVSNGSSSLGPTSQAKREPATNVLGSIDRLRKIYHIRPSDLESITDRVMKELKSPQNKSATAQDINDVIKNIVHKTSVLNQNDASLDYLNFSYSVRSRVFNVVDRPLSDSEKSLFSWDLKNSYA